MDKRLKKIIEASNNIVFFTGAGASTESGIPDFRSPKGLYNVEIDGWQLTEEKLSHKWLVEHPEEYFEHHGDDDRLLTCKPNRAHIAIAYLEKIGKVKAVVTQNVDGFHQKAGSVNVFELHGSMYRNYCMGCGKEYSLEYTLDPENCVRNVPRCKECGGIVRADITLYGEPLNKECLEGAKKAIREADTLIVGGTSLVVHPAVGLLASFKGEHLVIINEEETRFDGKAELVIRGSLGDALDIEGEEF